VKDMLQKAGLRVELDGRSESIGRKVREAELRKIPRMLIVGEREMQAGEASVREHGKGEEGSASIAELTEALLRDIDRGHGR
jgi:threonyl-tRNA synthetase